MFSLKHYISSGNYWKVIYLFLASRVFPFTFTSKNSTKDPRDPYRLFWISFSAYLLPLWLPIYDRQHLMTSRQLRLPKF